MYGSVCSGIEAATVAWHPLGWRPAWLAEIDPFCCALLKHHYPTVENRGDFTKIERSEPIDLLVGGTPCQSFSVAGKRAGLDDARGNLTLEFLALADRLRPRWLVWENVPGVMSDDGGRTFGTVLGILGQCGYGFAYRVLDAQHFGVPQRRRRVFVVGYLGDWRRAAAVLFERASLRGDPPPSRAKGKDVARCVATGTNSQRYDWETETFAIASHGGYREGAGTLRAAGGDYSGGSEMLVANPLAGHHGRDDLDNDTYVVGALQSGSSPNGHGTAGTNDQAVAAGHVIFDYKQSGEVNPTMRSLSHDKSHANNGSHLAVALPLGTRVDRGGSHRETEGNNLIVPLQAVNKPRSKGGHGIGVGSDGDPSFTMGVSEQHGVQLRSGVRRLTPRECERLQGFPDDYTLIPYRGKPASDGPRYRALGNSFAVPVVRWIGQRIQMVEDLERRAEERQQA